MFRASSKTHQKPQTIYIYFYLWLVALSVLLLWMAYLCKVNHARYKAERLEQRRRIVEGDPHNQRAGGSTPPRIPRWTEVSQPNIILNRRIQTYTHLPNKLYLLMTLSNSCTHKECCRVCKLISIM